MTLQLFKRKENNCVVSGLCYRSDEFHPNMKIVSGFDPEKNYGTVKKATQVQSITKMVSHINSVWVLCAI